MNTYVVKLQVYRETADIFSMYYRDPGAVFLDSSLQNKLGRYSIIGINPYLIMEERDGVFYRNHEPQEESFESVLSGYLKENQEENDMHLPMVSGAIGYFSYDYGRKFEHIESRHPRQPDIPEACVTFYDNLIIEDKVRKELYVTARGELERPELSVEKIIAAVETCQKQKSTAKGSGLAAYEANFDKEDYKRAVSDMIDYIVEGDIYIANMTQQLRIASEKDPYEVFRYLRIHNPSPFGSYFNCDGFQIVSSSPERFLKMRNGMIETRPIKGTRRRGNTAVEDASLRQELADSSKDRSELLMVVDLERNDLNHVCIPGSVEVTEHFAIEEYATVFHLVTTIVGKLRPEMDVTDLLKAAFPGGSITGTPKIRAMEIIDELEHGRRGLYTGSIGYISFDGSCDLNIVIRTAVHIDGAYYLGVGGGITCESELEFEYEETLQKAQAVLEAIEECD